MNHIQPLSKEYIPQNLKFKQNNTNYTQRNSNKSSEQSNLGIIVKKMLQSILNTKKYNNPENILKELDHLFSQYKLDGKELKYFKMKEIMLLSHKFAHALVKAYIKGHNISITSETRKKIRSKFGNNIYLIAQVFTNEYKNRMQNLNYNNNFSEDDLYKSD